ncbi:MAG: M48 family metallopeptidase [Candidatus Aminicenantes bacterium]|nr:M48 family metallopeptidase [Candidatus Aminicenantes bacterium]
MIENLLGWGKEGLILATIVSLTMTFSSYYWSDRIILAISRARPLEKREYPFLYHTVEGLALAAGLPRPACYLIDDSAPNAFTAGRSPRRAFIVVTRGLVEKLNRLELEGVIGHEMAHIKNHDTLLQTLTAVMVGIIVLLSDWWRRSIFWAQPRRLDKRKGWGSQLQGLWLILGFFLVIIAPFVAKLIRLAISRQREFLADAEGVRLTRYPPGLASALKKIAEDKEPLEVANRATAHLYIVNPLKEEWHRKISRLFMTHPPIEERIAALEKMGGGT